MPELKIKNLRSESSAWTRSLRYMADENILMKNRLSEVLQEDFNIELLPQVENFHSLFLTAEEFIGLLRHNISELDQLLANNQNAIFQGNEVAKMRSRLQSQMITAEERFSKLKREFYEFLAANAGI